MGPRTHATAEAEDLEFLACFSRPKTISPVTSTGHEELDGWRKVGITIDSGTADSVADPLSFPGYAVARHDGPIMYQSATGEPITNVGEQSVCLLTKEGSLRGMKFQATSTIKKPLASVRRITEAGHAVIFAPESYGGAFILNLESLEENSLREEDGNYLLDCWLPPAHSVGFGGHP